MPYAKRGTKAGGKRRRNATRRRAAPKRRRRRKQRAADDEIDLLADDSPAPRRSRSRRTATVSRYDPETGERVRVPKDSVEADEYLTAAEWKRERRKKAVKRERAAKEVERVVQRVVATPQVRERIAAGGARAASGLAGAGSAVGLGAGATAALLLAVGVASYYATTWLRDEIKAGRFDRAYLRSLAFRKAHTRLAAELGRVPTRDEMRALSDKFKQDLATIRGA